MRFQCGCHASQSSVRWCRPAAAFYLFDRMACDSDAPTTPIRRRARQAQPPSVPSAPTPDGQPRRHAGSKRDRAIARLPSDRPGAPAGRRRQVRRSQGQARRGRQGGAGSQRNGRGAAQDRRARARREGRLAIQLDRARSAIGRTTMRGGREGAGRSRAAEARRRRRSPRCARTMQAAQQKEAQAQQPCRRAADGDARVDRAQGLSRRRPRLQRGRADRRPRSGARPGARRAGARRNDAARDAE